MAGDEVTEAAIQELRDLTSGQAVEIHMLREKIEDLSLMREEFVRLNNSIESLVQAWNTASGVVKFVKWLGGLATAAAAIYLMIRVMLGHKL